MQRALIMARTVVVLWAATGCTAGYITTQSGAEWQAQYTGVVTFTNADTGTSYQVWASHNSSYTSFSFDPTAPVEHNGNYIINNPVRIPDGTYSVTVSDRYVWQSAANVQVHNGVNCPFTDNWTNQTTDCQMFNLMLLDCNGLPVPPFQSGNFTVVQLQQLNSGQCGAVSCPNHVIDVAGAYLRNPSIVEVYWTCPSGATGCTSAPNTGIWPALSGATEFWSRMVEYGTGAGAYAGSYSIPQPLPQFVTDSTIQNALQNQILFGAVKSPKSYLSLAESAIFVVYLPSGVCTSADGQTCIAEGAHHSSWYGADGQLYVFAVINRASPASSQDANAAHEVAEAATDAIPYNPGCGINTGCGWNEASTNQGEIGDLCGGNEIINGYNVAKVWSQKRCSCL